MELLALTISYKLVFQLPPGLMLERSGHYQMGDHVEAYNAVVYIRFQRIQVFDFVVILELEGNSSRAHTYLR